MAFAQTCPGSGCSTCNSTNTSLCLTCTDTTTPFYVTLDGGSCNSCSTVIPNCTSCTGNATIGATTCTGGCSSSLFLNDALTVCNTCNNIIGGCTNCMVNSVDNRTLCYQCANDSSTVPASNFKSCVACSSQITDCKSCNVNTATGVSTCLACTTAGNVPSANQTSCVNCSSLISDCSSCSVNSTGFSTCLACTTAGNVPSADHSSCTSCSSLISDCTSCSVNGTGFSTCLACTTAGNVPSADHSSCISCSSLISDCTSCNVNSTGSSTCLACGTAGNVPANNLTTCLPCSSAIADCSSCNVNSNGVATCLACTTAGNVPSLDKSTCTNCTNVISNCASCNVDSNGVATCLACSQSLVPSIALNSCESCSSAISNCNQCSVNSSGGVTCIGGCGNGLFVNGALNMCDTCSNIITGCTNCVANSSNSNQPVCSACGPGFLLSNGACTPCSSGCVACSDQDTCTQCNNGYSLSSAACLSTIPNCLNYTTDSDTGVPICQNCVLGYGLSMTGSCLPCTTSNCVGCSFDVNYLETCIECQDTTSIAKNGICLSCSSVNATYNTCSIVNGGVIPLSCAGSNFLLGTLCEDCSNVVSGGQLGCNSCSVNSAFTCVSCKNTFYLNSSNVCSQCPSGCDVCSSATVCNTCSMGYFMNGSSCSPCNFTNETGCSACGSDGITCSACSSGFYLNGSSTPSCAACTSNCLSCNSSGCSACNNGFYMTAANTCVKSCPTDNSVIANSTSMTCTPCSLITSLSTSCVSCSTPTTCLSCTSGQVLYSDGSACTFCNNTGESLNNNTPVTCNIQPTATLTSISVDSNTGVPSGQVTCSADSQVYYVYYIGDLYDNITWSNINSITGNTIANATIPMDLVYSWAGYGFIPNVVANIPTSLVFKRPWKYSGEQYTLIAFCYSQAGQLSGNTNVTWSFPSNGASIAVINLVSATPLSRNDKKVLGGYVKKALGINRNMYTDQGDLVNKIASSRILQNNSTNSTNSTNSSSGQNVSFYVVPDYTLVSDNLNTLVTTALTNTTSFVNTLTTSMGSSTNFSISSASLGQSISAQPIPMFSGTNPSVADTYISLTLNVSNTDGTIYVGIGQTLASTYSANVTNSSIGSNISNSSNSSNISNSSSNSVNALNLTAPSWTQMLNQTDVTGTSFVMYSTMTESAGNSVTVNLTGLSVNTTYNIYFGAANQQMPPQYSGIYVISATTTNSNSGNVGSGTSSAQRILAGLVLFLISILILGFE